MCSSLQEHFEEGSRRGVKKRRPAPNGSEEGTPRAAPFRSPKPLTGDSRMLIAALLALLRR